MVKGLKTHGRQLFRRIRPCVPYNLQKPPWESEMTNYQKGASFERDFIKKMSDNYYGVRTAGSHSQIDFILLPKPTSPFSRVVACQLKRYKKGACKPKITQEFRDLQFLDDADIVKWWVCRKDYCDFEIEVV